MRLDVPPAPFYAGESFFKDPAIPLRIVHIEPSPPFPRHGHGFTELVVVYGGRGRHIVNDREYLAVPGDVFLVPRGTAHEYRDPEDLCYVNVLFDETALLDEELFADCRGAPRDAALPDGEGAGVHRHMSVFAMRETMAIVNRIDQELYRRDYGYAQMARACFQELWISVLRVWRSARSTGDTPRARVERIADALRDNPAASITVRDMAREAGTCERNLYRMFRRVTGTSPAAFLNQVRVDKALELLRATDMSVTQVAFLVGYDDSSYFARQFRRLVGSSPTRYRADARGPGGHP